MKTLEKTIAESIAHLSGPVNVVAYELIHDGCGLSVNDSWRIASNVALDEVPAIARARWEIFRANYAPRARVSSISDIGYDNSRVELEAEGLAFLAVYDAE